MYYIMTRKDATHTKTPNLGLKIWSYCIYIYMYAQRFMHVGYVFLHFAVGILTDFTQVTQDCKYGLLIQMNPQWIITIQHNKKPCNKTGCMDISLFLAATKQLYKWYFPSVRPSVRLSVRHTFFTMFPSSYHHEIFRSYYQWQTWRPCKRSRSEVKGQGHRGQHPA